MSEEDNEPRAIQRPSREFVEALAKIAAMDTKMQPDKAGVEIEVPVRVYFSIPDRRFTKSPMEVLGDVMNAEKVIKEDWEKFTQTPGNEVPAPQSLRCRFVLEPMIADFEPLTVDDQLAETMDRLVSNNVHFSRVSLYIGRDPEAQMDIRSWTNAFGKLLRSTFGPLPIDPQEANTRYCPDPKLPRQMAVRHQINSIQVWCDGWQEVSELAAACSAIAVNQTTRKLTMELCIDDADDEKRAKAWQWIAYAFFSKRARAHSSLESLTLYGSIHRCQMSVADAEAFANILLSEHPEEELFGCPRGKVDERDATLKAKSPIRWHFDASGQLATTSQELTVETPIAFVRTFSDDGKSLWVDALVPGFGRCQLQRCDLVFDDVHELSSRRCSLSALYLAFPDESTSFLAGLPRFLAVVGPSLTFLALGKVELDVDENLFIGCCPNLRELAIRSSSVEARLNFRDFHANNKPLPALTFNRRDIAELAADLSLIDSPLAKCVRKLRVRVNDVVGDELVDNTLNAVVEMLKVNPYLEYLDVVLPQHHVVTDIFAEYHHKEVRHAAKLLPVECKAAFLSVLPSLGDASEPRHKRRVESRVGIEGLDEHVLRRILSLAASPVSREVYFRQAEGMDSDGERNEIPL